MKRRGFTLLELAAAMLLVGALTTLCLGFLAAVNGQRKEQFAELAATQEAANALEQLSAVAWNDLPRQSGDKYRLTVLARRALPEGRIEIHTEEAKGPPAGRRIEVAVFWRPQIGAAERHARLVAWRYKTP